MTGASADPADGREFEGEWRGPWYLGMSSGIATLTLTREKDGWSGILRMSNNERFGAMPMTLRSATYQDSLFVFRVVGEDGNVLEARLPAPTTNGGMLKGPGRYGGYKLGLELSKVQQPQ